MSRPRNTSRVRTLLSATVTPLASILGSGLLIIVPILERTLGALAFVGAIAISVLAWFIGTVIRHNVAVVEPAMEKGTIDRATSVVHRFADVVIVVAYVISVALYLRIMAQYIVHYFQPGGSTVLEAVIASGAVVLIVLIGVLRGFGGLHTLDQISLTVVLVLTVVLGAALFANDAALGFGPGISVPPIPNVDPLTTLLILGGSVITVQGFETVRYLGEHYDATTRIRASRVAQLTAAVIYVAFVIAATPVMGLGTAAGADDTLLAITARVAPWLALPLVLSAVLSQFSAAVADVSAADGNLRGLSRLFSGHRPYFVTGIAAIVMASTLPLLLLVSVASRAFAAYYGLEAVIALRTSSGFWRKLGFGSIAVLMFGIALFAEPAR
ncbi:MAG: hypothetical protein KF801_05505 [Cryobacterium sp.]|nr:hypothetical protein [Cryobacterium sp.]